MRKFVVIAAALAFAGTGVLAAGRQDAAPKADAPKAQADKPEVKTRKKTFIIQRDDDGGPPMVQSWTDNGDFDAPIAPGLMLPTGPRIGVTVANLDNEQSKSASGVIVTSVRQDGPAAKAGVKEKDVIAEFDGERVRSAKQLTRLVSETPDGRSAKLTAIRDGKRLDLQVTPEADERPMTFRGGGMHPDLRGEVAPWNNDRMPRVYPDQPNLFFHRMPDHGRRFDFKGPGPGEGDENFDVFIAPGRGRLGVGIQELSEQLADYFGTKDGVLVTSVTKDSPAAKAGIRAGDVITSVNDQAVTSTEALVESVQKAGDGATLTLGYVRDKKPGTASATLETGEQSRPKRETKPI